MGQLNVSPVKDGSSQLMGLGSIALGNSTQNSTRFYQPGERIGVVDRHGKPIGEMVYGGVKDDGYYYVSGRAIPGEAAERSYRIPPHLHGADEVRDWVIRQVNAGHIDQRCLFPLKPEKQNPHEANPRILGTNLNVGGVLRQVGDGLRNVPIPLLNITPKRLEQVVHSGHQQIDRILRPYGDAKPWKGELGGAQLTATPIAIQGKQITWRIDIERGGQKLGSFETKFSGQLGAAQFKEGSPLKKQVMGVVSQQQIRVLDSPAGEPVVVKKGRETLVTQLYEQQTWKNGVWQKSGYVTKGMSVYTDDPINSGQKREKYGYFTSAAPGKTRLITEANSFPINDADRTPITDLSKARKRVEEILNYDGLTTTTDVQAIRARQNRERQQKNRSRLPDPLNQQVKAPGIDYSRSQSNPNTIQGSFTTQKVERSQGNVRWQSQSSDGAPNFSAMIVPNIVFEQGLTGNDKKNISVTPQPFTGFFPVSGGLPGFRSETNGSALYRSTLHPAGFYPGDPNWQRWHQEYTKHPERTPEYQVVNWGYIKTIKAENWYQVYWNSPNMLNPLVGGSINQREIKERVEVRVGLYEQKLTAMGRDSS